MTLRLCNHGQQRQIAHRSSSVTALFAVLALLAAGLALPAAGDTIEKFQHGGRATAQAGAFTARADEPSAVTYNPAAIVRLNGLQAQAGADFTNPTDEYNSSSNGEHRADHNIQFPAIGYVTWRPEGHGRLAYGLGVDTPVWYRLDWSSALFPGRFRTRTQEVRLYQVHPVVAYELSDRWSVGGGLRYLFGTLEYGFNTTGEISFNGAPLPFELQSLAKADIDAVTFDLAVHYDAVAWGAGLVYEGAADFEESGDLSISTRDLVVPALQQDILALFPFGTAEQRFELPRRVRTGVWIAPYPELRIELDAVYSGWSSLGNTDVVLRSTQLANFVIPQERNWDDTVSLRLGVEGEISEAWSIGAGLAWEPSPVPDKTAEPGFSRGDAIVYAIGGTYNLPTVSIDVGYSFYDFDRREVGGQEPLNPGVRGEYQSRDQAWSITGRWRF